MELASLGKVAAVAFAVCGIWLLQAAWRARSGNGLRLGAAWSLTAMSIIVWAAVDSADRGTAIGIVGVMLTALAFLGRAFAGASTRGMRSVPDLVVRHAPLSRTVIVRRSFVGVLIGPGAGLSALALSAAGFAALDAAGTEHTAALVVAMFGFPLVWAGLAVLAGADPVLWRKTLTVLGLGLVPAFYLSLFAR